jgi:hypothetical protein
MNIEKIIMRIVKGKIHEMAVQVINFDIEYVVWNNEGNLKERKIKHELA